MIGTSLMAFGYFVNGAIVTLLWALVMLAMWGHRHGLSLSQVFQMEGSDDKMTLRDLGWLLLAIALWPVFTVGAIVAIARYSEELLDTLDGEFRTVTGL